MLVRKSRGAPRGADVKTKEVLHYATAKIEVVPVAKNHTTGSVDITFRAR
jgi:hypothetical protein